MGVLGIRFPFRFSVSGGVQKADGVDKIVSNLKALVFTALKERVIRKNVGTIGYQRIFRSGDDTSLDLVKNLVREAIATHEPRVLVLSLKVRSVEDREGVKEFIDVLFVFRETGEEGTATVEVTST